MSDNDPLKKYWQNRAAGQSPIPKPASPMIPTRGLDGEINLGQMLQQRMMNQMTSSPTTNVVQLRPGAPLYRKLNTQGFMEGHTNLVVYLGPSSVEHQNKQFENKGVKSCVLVENQSALIDLSETSSTQQNKVNLVEIAAPFIGTFFVLEQYIIRSTTERNSSNSSLLTG